MHANRVRAPRRFWALLTGLVLGGLLLASAAAASSRPAADCQPFGASPCLLPFPSNLFTRSDHSTPTGLRVRLPARAMPAAANGQRISVAEYNRNDGFSPGSALIVHVPGLDNAKALARTGAAGMLNLQRSLDQRQPIVVIDETTGAPQLVYTQLDGNAGTPQATDLLILPGRQFTEGHTYVVAMRNLRGAAGHRLNAPAWFAKLRDNRRLPAPERSQRARYARIFAALKRAGIARGGLYEAWDFTVASAKNLTSRLLSIRNHAFRQLGDHNLADGKAQGHAPAFQITSTTSLTPQLRDVQGTFSVPCYLVTCGASATTGFHYSSAQPDALPTQAPGNVATAPFQCIVPTSASATKPARISLYGHGLLGSNSEVTDSWVQALATQHNMVFCATDSWGLAQGDTGFAATAVTNLSLFPRLVDRLQQGVLNTLFLGRLMLNSQGLAANPAFQQAGRSVLDTSHLYYDGNSQGGIEGGLTTAVAPDFTHAVLGVTGMDYGNLLVQRSTDFAPFKAILDKAYPDPSLYPVILDVLQQLWDRGDPDGYAQQMTAHPLPDTPTHVVLMQLAYGDFQVSMYAGAAEARTIGASAYEPALDPARARNGHLLYGIPAIGHYPFAGSAVEIWDSGPGRVQSPPLANVPPTGSTHNLDPHQNPRDTPAAQSQISAFLRPAGKVIDACGGKPCHSSVFTP